MRTQPTAPLYPIFISLTGIHCLVVGLGQVGQRKLSGLLACNPASVLVLELAAPTPEAAALLDDARVHFERRSCTQADLQGRALVFAATGNAAENSRIMGILNCEEAHGREEQARVLAETPGMTVETARRILAVAPQSAQARSDTALDRLMQGAPAPLAAGNLASDTNKELLNTPEALPV